MKPLVRPRGRPPVYAEPVIKSAVYIPLSLHRKLRIRAATEGTSMTSIITNVLTEYFNKESVRDT